MNKMMEVIIWDNIWEYFCKEMIQIEGIIMVKISHVWIVQILGVLDRRVVVLKAELQLDK